MIYKVKYHWQRIAMEINTGYLHTENADNLLLTMDFDSIDKAEKALVEFGSGNLLEKFILVARVIKED